MSFRERHGALIFWIPVGLASLLSFRWFPAPNPQAASPTNLANGATDSIRLGYELVENTTMVNHYGETSRVLRYSAVQRLASDSSAFVSTLAWAELLSDGPKSEEYTAQFMDLLASAPLKAYFFETKGVTLANANVVPFEFVLVESTYLYRFADAQQDPLTFAERFEQCKGSTVGCAFPNPSGTSILVAPLQLKGTDENTYGHLAAFAQRAPKEQKAEDPRKVWLSTDGTGVAWLHVRLDPKPKYYDYGPYKEGG